MRIRNFYGRELGINCDGAREDMDPRKVQTTDLDIYGGSPMSLHKFGTDEDSSIASYVELFTELGGAAACNIPVHGLAKFNCNAYKNETNASDGTYGGGKGVCVVSGEGVTLYPNHFAQSDGSVVRVSAFVTTDSFVAMDALYVELGLNSAGTPSADFGKITRTLDGSNNQNTRHGIVTNFWTSAVTPVLEMKLQPVV